MSAELVTPGLLEIKLFQNKGYDIIIFDYNVTKKMSSKDSNYTVYVIMWPKFGNTSISVSEFIVTSIS